MTHRAPYWSAQNRVWHVTRHADVASLLQREDLDVAVMSAFFADVARRSGTDLAALTDALERIPVFLNPPAHGPERRIMARTLAGVSGSDIERIVSRYLAAMCSEALKRGGLDAATDFADVVAMGVLVDLMGLPESDIPLLNELTRGVLAFTNRSGSLAQYRALNEKASAGVAYLLDLVRQRRARPGDDLVSRMLALVNDHAEDERTTACRLYTLLMVGTETSATFLSHTALRFIEHPDQRELVASRRDLMARSVEELLRLSTPARYSTRTSRDSLEIGGAEIPSSQLILLDLHAANRDPAVFRHPDTIDLENTAPHLSFSDGLHHCIGARFARIEGMLGVAALVDLPPMRAAEPISMIAGIDILPRIQALPVVFV